MGCARQASLIHEGPTSQITGLKGSAARVFVPDMTGNLQSLCGFVDVLEAQRRHTQY